jgi:type I restriction enzyme S subunit
MANGELPEGWERLPFDECVLPPNERKKSIQQNLYVPAGQYPIVDQGEGMIAGYTDDPSTVYRENLPMILFGDHTRNIKYLDFPFATGADGTKLFLARPGKLEPKYLYFALRALGIPSRGYNRHFKYLREQVILAPQDMREQQAIANVLSKLQEAVEVQDRIIATLKELKAATLAKLFREGLRGEPLKQTEIGEIPESWEIVLIRNLGEIVTGTTPPTVDRTSYDGDIPFIAPGDLGEFRVVRKAQKSLSKAGLRKSRGLPARSVLVVCIGSTIGKVGMTEALVSTTNQQINAITCREGLSPEFVHYLMLWNADRISNMATPSPVPILSKGSFGEIAVAMPSDSQEAEDIATVLCAIDDSMERETNQRGTAEQLFQSMLHLLMTGELRLPIQQIGEEGGAS